MAARVVFMGSPAFAVPTLAGLSERPDLVEIVGVWTQPDRPAGRGNKLRPPPVKVAAMARGIPVFQPTKMRRAETREALRALKPDLCIVAAYGRILPQALLDVAPFGCINVHASILPKYRGASPIHHAIWAQDSHTGVAIMQMEAGLDTGPVFGIKELPIEAKDTTASMTIKLAELGGRYLIELLPQILDSSLVAQNQGSEHSYAGLLAKDDGLLDFSQSATQVEAHLRAMFPWPVGQGVLEGLRIQILEAEVVAGEGRAGEVIAADPHDVIVACGEGALKIVKLKIPAKPAMSSQAWFVGRGVRLGQRFQLFKKPSEGS